MRRLLLPVTGAIVAAGVLAASAAGERSVAVSLSAVGSASANVSTTKGTTVSLVARAVVHPGDRLVITATRGSETKVRGVAVCPRSPCTGRWTEQVAVSDRFQAFVAHGAGRSLRILGRSRLVRVTWEASPPTPPPPPSPATPGHYEGRSSFNEAFRFDVSADGKSVVDLVTGQINESCTPAAHISGGNLKAPGPYPIAADGSFSISGTLSISISGAAGTRRVAITGRFAGAAADGTFRTDTTFTLAGTGYTCNSGDQTWTATKL